MGRQADDSAMERTHGLAPREIQVACSVHHVEELVIHWMTTGSLDYPFARTAQGFTSWRPTGPDCRVDLSGARQIGELAVHRESIERGAGGESTVRYR